MSKDTIYREDAIEAIHREARLAGGSVAIEYADMFQDALKSLPTADRPQGEWKPFDLTWGRSIYACSVCEEAIAVPCGWSDGKPIYDYCPMCGARLKGADDEQ